MSPISWASAYVGLPYVLGEGECGHRAAAVWRERFGFEVEITPARGDLRKARRIIEAQMAGPDWHQVDEPSEGDAVVMRKGELLCHVGVWVDGRQVLHCTRADGTVLTPVEELPSQGFHVVGYYHRSERSERRLAA